MTTTGNLPILPFPSAASWEQWLSDNHSKSAGVWVQVAKKASGIPSVTHDEALDVALCYGWIDGQRKPYDDTYFLQKFTPRRSKSLWSKRNIEKIAALTAAGRMQPAGMAEVEAAKRDGRWEAAYDSSKHMVLPEDLLEALAGNQRAQTFFETLNRTNVYAIVWRLQTAKKPETRKRRLEAIVAMLDKGEKFHP
jgi:uncharacterized protein YdeI (YjbR/CyaY-like superfamily)